MLIPRALLSAKICDTDKNSVKIALRTLTKISGELSPFKSKSIKDSSKLKSGSN